VALRRVGAGSKDRRGAAAISSEVRLIDWLVQEPTGCYPVRNFRLILLKNCGHKPWTERRARDELFTDPERSTASVGSGRARPGPGDLRARAYRRLIPWPAREMPECATLPGAHEARYGRKRFAVKSGPIRLSHNGTRRAWIASLTPRRVKPRETSRSSQGACISLSNPITGSQMRCPCFHPPGHTPGRVSVAIRSDG
jgi:hypothetical protein